MAAYKCTDPDQPRQLLDQDFLISSWDQVNSKFRTCPRAQTLLARSLVHGRWMVRPLPCNTWSCKWCSRRKLAALARRVKLACPNRLLTLTVDPSLHETPRAAFDATRRDVPVLARELRKRLSEFEFLRVLEIHKSGYPHYHLLVRSPYVAHQLIRSLWSRLTGAFIVDIRQVKKKFNAAFYITKYLSKCHTVNWTERRLTFSKKFFVPEEPPVFEDLKIYDRKIVNMHPSNYLYVHETHSVISPWLQHWFVIDAETNPTGPMTLQDEEYNFGHLDLSRRPHHFPRFLGAPDRKKLWRESDDDRPPNSEPDSCQDQSP